LFRQESHLQLFGTIKWKTNIEKFIKPTIRRIFKTIDLFKKQDTHSNIFFIFSCEATVLLNLIELKAQAGTSPDKPRQAQSRQDEA
jgi:hypothetical protein